MKVNCKEHNTFSHEHDDSATLLETTADCLCLAFAGVDRDFEL
jgi:hypothetical protein